MLKCCKCIDTQRGRVCDNKSFRSSLMCNRCAIVNEQSLRLGVETFAKQFLTLEFEKFSKTTCPFARKLEISFIESINYGIWRQLKPKSNDVKIHKSDKEDDYVLVHIAKIYMFKKKNIICKHMINPGTFNSAGFELSLTYAFNEWLVMHCI